MKKSDENLRQAQEDMEHRKRLLIFGKIRVDPEPTVKSPIKQKDQEKDVGQRKTTFMTITRNLAFIGFGFYVGIGPGIYTSGRTEVSGLGYVHYENSPPKQPNLVYNLFQPSTEVDSGSAAAFILLTTSL